jgi:hypothetical protein
MIRKKVKTIKRFKTEKEKEAPADLLSQPSSKKGKTRIIN